MSRPCLVLDQRGGGVNLGERSFQKPVIDLKPQIDSSTTVRKKAAMATTTHTAVGAPYSHAMRPTRAAATMETIVRSVPGRVCMECKMALSPRCGTLSRRIV